MSRPRRFVADLLQAAQRVPSVPMQRRMRLADVVAARRARAQRISWCAIFLKAYGLVSADRPELRRCYLSFPVPRIYEHPQNVASFSLERSYRGEDGVFFAQIPQPEKLGLAELDSLVRYFKSAPLEGIGSFRHAMLLSSMPQPLRRFVWWLGLSVDGMYRARFFGTYGVSVVASLGAASLHLLSPLSTTLNYGVFEPDCTLDVRVAYDHRVLDGAPMARAMAALEEVLHRVIVPELRELAGDRSRSAKSQFAAAGDDGSGEHAGRLPITGEGLSAPTSLNGPEMVW